MLLALISFWAVSGESADPQSPLKVAAEREIVELHAFFQSWYRGEGGDADFDRFDGALADGFVIVLPDARILQRAAIVEAVRGQRASDPLAALEVRNIQPHRSHGDTVIFTYEEWQGRRGEAQRGRLSTVVFAIDPAAPNGLRWLHVHETWLPDSEDGSD